MKHPLEAALEERTDGLRAIPIEGFALGKMKTYAQLAGANELYGFLVSPLDKQDGIVYDAILAPDQRVSGASAEIDDQAVGNMKAELENLGLKAIGFWHSHGNLNPYHSSIDNKNMDEMMASLAGNNEFRISKSFRNYCSVDPDKAKIVYRTDRFEISVKVEKNDLSYESKFSPANPLKLSSDSSQPVFAFTQDARLLIHDGTSIIVIRNPYQIDIQKPQNQEVKVIGLAYSIVVNNRGDQYAELAINSWCSQCEREEIEIRKDVNIKVIGSIPSKYDENVLRNDLAERVIDFKPGRFKKIFKNIRGEE